MWVEWRGRTATTARTPYHSPRSTRNWPVRFRLRTGLGCANVWTIAPTTPGRYTLWARGRDNTTGVLSPWTGHRSGSARRTLPRPHRRWRRPSGHGHPNGNGHPRSANANANAHADANQHRDLRRRRTMPRRHRITDWHQDILTA